MKKLIHSIIGLMLSATVFAQAPQSFKYQAVARDASGEVVANQHVSFQISILQGNESGTAVYMETHVDSTNQFGLITLEIGTGTTTDDFTAIDWDSDAYFIQIEMDASGGTSYILMGTSQLLSVPYALHAKTAEKANSYTETDPVFGSSVARSIAATDTSNWNNKLDNYNETDPIFGSSIAAGITGTDTTNWNNKLDSYTETDPLFGAHTANSITSTNITNWTTAYGWGEHSTAGYLTSFTETDPVFASHIVNGITSSDTANWNTAFGWDNHSTVGYLTNYTETDPIFSMHISSGINATDTVNWNTAYSWSDHSTAGYLESYTETDPQVGANTTDYLSKWDGSTLVSSTIFDNGNIGIGTTSPQNKLDIEGGAVIGATYSGTNTAPTNGLLVEGNVGIGTTTPGVSTSNGIELFGDSPAIRITSGYWTQYAFELISTYDDPDGQGGMEPVYRFGIKDVNTDQEMITITSDGSIGMGTTNPGGLLGLHDANTYINVDGSNNLTLTDAVTGTKTLAELVDDADADPNNEIQNLSAVLSVNNDGGASQIKNIADPSDNQDAATKAYVDELEARLRSLISTLKPPVQQRLDEGETPYQIYQSDNSLLDSLYGKSYEGGLIFYLNSSDGSGFVSASSDQSTGIPWWNGSYISTGATGTAIGTGQTNTTTIVNAQGVGSYAAQLCDDLSLNGYSDWFLPSKDELNAMYTNLYQAGLCGFPSFYYWSSSEHSSTQAWAQYFQSSIYQNEEPKQAADGVRAVRAF